ncbi:MAG TPA: hypothetical protein VD833_07545 [Vicinamibacterales bacterium]|nr:hypothetical protein [Vicinamibacterales bacterium]
MTDPLLRMLSSLPDAAPDPVRAARVRQRCHSALAPQRPRGRRRLDGWRLRALLLAGLGGLYLMEAVRQAILSSGLV